MKTILLSYFILSSIPFSTLFSQNKTTFSGNFSAVTSVGNSCFVVVGEMGAIFLSTDNGLSWLNTSPEINTVEAFNDVCFISQYVGFAVGSNSRLYKTTDGGYTWSKKNLPLNINLSSIAFTSDLIGNAIGDNANVLHTTDGGNIWTTVSLPSFTNKHPIRVAMNSYGEGVIVGTNYMSGPTTSYQTLYVTSNGGVSWGDVVQKLNTHLFGVTSNGKGSFVVVGYDYGRIFNSSDGGFNWTQISSPAEKLLTSVDFSDSLNGVIAGYAQTILKTTNGGSSWDIVSGPGSGEYTGITLNQNTGVVVGVRGLLYRSTDSGSTWNKIILSVTDQDDVSPHKYFLTQNYPNPFNSRTKINYSIPEESYVELTITNLLGQNIGTLVNWRLNPGSYSTEWDANSYSSGIYFYTLKSTGFIVTKKINLIK